MSSWQLIIQQQIVKPLQTRAGTFGLLASLGIWILFLYYPIRKSAEAFSDPTSPVEGIVSAVGLDNLANWVLPELGAYWALALYVLPPFAILVAADQMISERLRGGLRFLLLRAKREELFFGRFAGQLIIQLLLIIATIFSATMMGVLRTGDSGFIVVHSHTLLITGVQLLIIVMPFIALMSLLSVLLNKVRTATIIAMLLFAFGESVFRWLGTKVPGLDYLALLVPGNQLSQMLNNLPPETRDLLAYPIAQSLVFMIVGYLLFRRQSV